MPFMAKRPGVGTGVGKLGEVTMVTGAFCLFWWR